MDLKTCSRDWFGPGIEDMSEDCTGYWLSEKHADDMAKAMNIENAHSGLTRQSTVDSTADERERHTEEDVTDCESTQKDVTDCESTRASAASTCSRSHLDRWAEPSETLVIFDWDDTLCPTSHTVAQPSCEHDDAAALEEHFAAVEDLLLHAADIGHVAIVTMAAEGWVERCAKRYMPRLEALLERLQIPVFVARSSVPAFHRRGVLEECRDPGQFLKTHAIERAVREFYSGQGERPRSWKNILSIGDSQAERLALQDVVFRRQQRDRCGRWKECRCKTLLLLEQPSLAQLTAELRLVVQWLPALVCHDGDADLEVDLDDLAALDPQLAC